MTSRDRDSRAAASPLQDDSVIARSPADLQQAAEAANPFQPLFGLVTDGTLRTTHHPSIRYIFSDDDSEILNEALARASQGRTSASSPSSSVGSDHATQIDRAILVDLAYKKTPAGPDDDSEETLEVASAAALSSDWAIVTAKLETVQQDESTTSGSSDDGRNNDAPDASGKRSKSSKNTKKIPKAPRWMLQVEGSTVAETSTTDPSPGSSSLRPDVNAAKARGSSVGKDADDYAVLIGDFNKRLNLLRKVFEAGEERQKRINIEAHTVSLAAPMEGAAQS